METVFLKLPREPRYMLALRLMAAGLANLAAFSSEDIEDLKLAVSEACFRAPGQGSMLELAFHLEGGRVTVEVMGSSFSQRPMLTLSDPADEGIGFLLMRNLMDSIELKSDEAGTSIRMTKRARRLAPAENV